MRDRSGDGLLAPDHRGVQAMGEDLGTVPVGELLRRAVVVAVPMGDHDPADAGRVQAETSHRTANVRGRARPPGGSTLWASFAERAAGPYPPRHPADRKAAGRPGERVTIGQARFDSA